MARCNLTSLSNLERACTNKGGVYTEIYITLRENLDEVTFVETEAPYNTIQTITLKDGKKWNVLQYHKNSVNFTSTAQFDSQTGQFSYFENALNLQFRRMDAVLRLNTMSLLQNECIVLVTDNNGVTYLMGYEEFVSANSATFDSGVNKTDSNLVSITLVDTTTELPYHLSETAMATVKANLQE